MEIKPGVRLAGISPIIVLALVIVERIFSKLRLELVITSVTDGRHMEGSLHHCGLAVDIRRPTYVHTHALVTQLRKALGSEFDVVMEPTHIHIEYDPK